MISDVEIGQILDISEQNGLQHAGEYQIRVKPSFQEEVKRLPKRERQWLHQPMRILAGH